MVFQNLHLPHLKPAVVWEFQVTLHVFSVKASAKLTIFGWCLAWSKRICKEPFEWFLVLLALHAHMYTQKHNRCSCVQIIMVGWQLSLVVYCSLSMNH